MRREDLTGKVYGRLKFISFHSLTKVGNSNWLCECICGRTLVVCASNVKRGVTKSCGCLLSEVSSKRHLTHGDLRLASKSKEYNAWASIKSRCYKPLCKEYRWYGSRGIKMCDRWLNSYENFLTDMGRAPSPKHSIDRIDNNGNYYPGNCRWSTVFEQMNNRRNTMRLTFNGETKSLNHWCLELGLKKERIYYRVKRLKWSAEMALTIP